MIAAFKSGIWFADFEYHAAGRQKGNILLPVCLVARELASGTTIRVWRDELQNMSHPPVPVDKHALFVAYAAYAEMACFRALNWSVPANILDLYAEFRNFTNDKPLPAGKGLIGALTYFGEPCMGAMEKDTMRALVLRGGPWSATEQQQILDYCESDVIALRRLFVRMEGMAHG